jgi:hypothetical protein
MMINQAAIMDTTGKVWTLPRPARHSTIINLMMKNNVNPRKCFQGFVDEAGKFYTRQEALIHAIEHNQTFYLYDPRDTSKRFVDNNPKKTGPLFSEDLW